MDEGDAGTKGSSRGLWHVPPLHANPIFLDQQRPRRNRSLGHLPPASHHATAPRAPVVRASDLLGSAAARALFARTCGSDGGVPRDPPGVASGWRGTRSTQRRDGSNAFVRLSCWRPLSGPCLTVMAAAALGALPRPTRNGIRFTLATRDRTVAGALTGGLLASVASLCCSARLVPRIGRALYSDLRLSGRLCVPRRSLLKCRDSTSAFLRRAWSFGACRSRSIERWPCWPHLRKPRPPAALVAFALVFACPLARSLASDYVHSSVRCACYAIPPSGDLAGEGPARCLFASFHVRFPDRRRPARSARRAYRVSAGRPAPTRSSKPHPRPPHLVSD